MTIRPAYHWQFEEEQGSTATDIVSGVEATLRNTRWVGHGRIGHAIEINGRNDNSRVDFGNVAGQFGTSNFTVAFGMKLLSTHGQNDLDVFGNRRTGSHGNWFCIRMKRAGQLSLEVDENKHGKNYAVVASNRRLIDKKWHHVTVVREGRSLKLYIDGELSAEGVAKTGIADINNGHMLRLGMSRRKSAIARYEDIRIYHTALNAVQVKNLVPPVNRLLREGEIELVAPDDAAVILTEDVADLYRFLPGSQSLRRLQKLPRLQPLSGFQKLRLGPNTGVTLYQRHYFAGTAQKCYADLPDIRRSRLDTFPGSIRIWPAAGEPFTGKWVIKAPDGQFLSLGKSSLTTAPQRSFDELFRFHYNLQHAQLQLLPGSDHVGASLRVAPGAEPVSLFVDASDRHNDAFALINAANNQWLQLTEDHTFRWTRHKEDRAVFVRLVKMADNEGQVGALSPGDVALYEHVGYYGRTWILSDRSNDRSGNYAGLQTFQHLDERTSSIRLGPDTGVTVYAHESYEVTADNREKEIEDIVENVPDLRETQIGNDAISAIKIFRTVAPETIFTSFTSKLSQDYRMVGNDLEEFSAYRTTLRVAPGTGQVEVSATDLTTIEVAGTTYAIDEERSVTLRPNAMSRIVITSEADGIHTPGLKFRTGGMADNERVVMFPNQAVHQQIADLEDNALWNATDAQGNRIVDRKTHSEAEVASVQSTIKKAMATVTYTADASVDASVGARRVHSHGRTRIQSVHQAIDSTAITAPWEITFAPARTTSEPTARPATPGLRLDEARIQEREMSQDEFMRLLSQADTRSSAAARPLRGFRGFFKRIKDAIKKAVAVVVGAVEKVIHVIVTTAEEVIDFVVDTVEKVVAAVEGFVERVVAGIKQFIEFLQFVFDWDDIVATQRYLVAAIHSGLDFATQLAETAKQPVAAFVDNLQDTVEDGINTLTRALGDDPSAVQRSDFALPEAVEWFFAKLLGGSQQAGANTTPDGAPHSSEDSAPATFVAVLFERFEDVAGMLQRGFEGLGETIAALIANPRQPQLALVAILETLRDVVIQSLDVVENVALGFLDVVGEAIELFKNLMNGEIHIPFISNLFELLGAGKLTPLNLATLLLAIPATVVSKVAFNERPFQGALPPDFLTQTEARPAATVAQGSLDERLVERSSNTSEPDPVVKTLRSWGSVAIVADVVNGVLTAALDVTPEKADTQLEQNPYYGLLELLSLALDLVSWVPSIPGFPKVRKEDFSGDRGDLVWYWRTAILGVDILWMGYGWGIKEPRNVQRMKRGNTGTILMFTGAVAIDAGLTGYYLADVENKRIEIPNEVFSLLPDLLCFLRLSGPKGALALAIIDVIATLVTTGLGGKLLADDVAALEEALQGN